MLRLPKEVQKDIFTSLSIIDRVSLELTCKDLKECKPTSIPERTFFDIFRERLAEHVGDQLFLPLLQFIEETGCIISGSFILDCLYDTNFHDDIDIYPIGDCGPKMRDLIEGTLSTVITKLQETTVNFSTIVSYEIIATGRKVQFVLLDCDPDKFITQFADIDITKSRYSKGKLKVISWDKLISRKDYTRLATLLVFHRMYYSGQRTGEYKGADHSAIALKRARQEKYISRGFDITKHPKSEELKAYMCSLDVMPTWQLMAKIDGDEIDIMQFG